MTEREGVGSRERDRRGGERERGGKEEGRERERKVVGERKCDGATHIIKACFARINSWLPMYIVCLSLTLM